MAPLGGVAPSAAPPSAAAPNRVPGQPPLAPRPAKRHVDAQLSLIAIVGAVWASLFFVMLILLSIRGDASLVPGQSPPLWHALLDYVIQPLGWAAPIAATVLGLMAISEIQKSDGEKYGLSLALFDALFYPLLLLDFIVLWLCWQGAAALIQQDVMSPAVARAVLGQIVPILAIILGDYYLATRAWSAIKPEAEK